MNNSPRSSLVSSGLAGLTNSMESEAFDVGDAKVQHYGLLMKKPFGHKSARWQKRFVCVIVCADLTDISVCPAQI